MTGRGDCTGSQVAGKGATPELVGMSNTVTSEEVNYLVFRYLQESGKSGADGHGLPRHLAILKTRQGCLCAA